MDSPAGQPPSRLQKCACGSGLRFKDCHGRLDGLRPVPHSVPPEILAAVREQEQQRREHEAAHGELRPIVTAEFKGHRFVAVGGKLHFAPTENFKVFPDFLNTYLHSRLVKEWGEKQLELEFELQHPVVQWRTIWMTRQQKQERDADGLFSQDSGAGILWFHLAYDLYLLDHHEEMQKRLLRRLRDPVAFQGARLEIVAAASLLPAGFVLDFADDKGPGKHPEFVATNRATNQQIAVEAKSRHRRGVLGREGDRSIPANADIRGLLAEAVAKDPPEPLLIFLELNMPVVVDEAEAPPEALGKELEAAWRDIQAQEWPKGFPAIGVVFYNDAAPWFLEQMPAGRTIWAMAFWAEKHRHALDAKALLASVLQSIHQRLTIPLHFTK